MSRSSRECREKTGFFQLFHFSFNDSSIPIKILALMQIDFISFPFRQLQKQENFLKENRSIGFYARPSSALMMMSREGKSLDLAYCSQFAFIVRSFRQQNKKIKIKTARVVPNHAEVKGLDYLGWRLLLLNCWRSWQRRWLKKIITNHYK